MLCYTHAKIVVYTQSLQSTFCNPQEVHQQALLHEVDFSLELFIQWSDQKVFFVA